MPPAVAALAASAAAAATTAGATAATAAFVSGAVTVGANLAIGVGLSFVAGLIRGKPPGPKPSSGLIEYQQPIPPRMWHYGRVKVSGPLAFFEDWQTSGYAGKIVLLSSRQIDAIEVDYLDDRILDIVGTGNFNVENRYEDAGVNKAGVHTFLGTDSQTADSHIQSIWPVGVWSTNHRLRGIAYAALLFGDVAPQDFNGVFPNGMPNYKALIRASLLYDPRLDGSTGGTGSHRHNNKATWAWSENLALAILDYLTHADGYDIDLDRFDLASFRSYANVCDQNVTLKAGGTEDRYRIANTVFMNEPRTSVLTRLLETGDAQLYQTATGDLAIRGGVWTSPTVTITQDHILKADFSQGVDAMARYNEIALQYRSPDHGYGEVEGDPWRNEADITATGKVKTRNMDFTTCPSHGQARRLAKIRMARDNPNWVGEIETDFYGLNAIGERTITVQWDELEIDEPFWVESIGMLESGAGMRLKIRSASEASYNWNAATEEGTAPDVPQNA